MISFRQCRYLCGTMALLASSMRFLEAQVSSRAISLPILRPIATTVIAEFIDSGRADLPGLGVSASSPNGRLLVIGTERGDWTLYNTVTHARTVLVNGPVHGGAWGPKGDMLVLQTHPGPLSYQGKELSRLPSIYVIRVDPNTGDIVEPAHVLAQVSVNHGLFLSPDEQTIAFAQAYGWYVSTLSVVPVSGGQPRVLATGIEVHRIHWSGDGSFLTYTAFKNSSSDSRLTYRISAAGGAPVPIEETKLAIVGGVPVETRYRISGGIRTPVAPRPSSEYNVSAVVDQFTGHLAAYYAIPRGLQAEELDFTCRTDIAATRRVRPRGLRVLSVADQKTRVLIDTTMSVIGEPRWLPGNRVAVFVRDSDRTALVIRGVDGRDRKTLTIARVGPEVELAPSLRIAPNGRFAAFIGALSGFETVELLDLITGQQRMLTAVPADFADGSSPEGIELGDLAWRDDSKAIRYIRDFGNGDPSVHEVTIAGSDRLIRPLPKAIYGSATFAFFPAGGHGELVEYGGNPRPDGVGWAITLVPVNGELPSVAYSGGTRGGPISPDGRMLAAQTGTPKGDITISLAPVTTPGLPRVLSLPFFALRGVQWHPDGRLLVLGREEGDSSFNVYGVPGDGAAPSIFARFGATRAQPSWALSPDGRFIAFTTSGTERVTLMRVSYDLTPIRKSRVPCP